MRFYRFDSAPSGLHRQVFSSLVTAPVVRGETPLEAVLDLTMLEAYNRVGPTLSLGELGSSYWAVRSEQVASIPVGRWLMERSELYAKPILMIPGTNRPWREIRSSVKEQVDALMEEWGRPSGLPDLSRAGSWSSRDYTPRPFSTYHGLQIRSIKLNRSQYATDARHSLAIRTLEV